MKSPVALFFFMSLFGTTLLCPCLCAQNKSISYSTYASVNAGFSKLRWLSSSQFGQHYFEKTMQESGKLLGVSIAKSKDSLHVFSMHYEFQKTRLYSGQFSLAQGVIENHVFFSYSKNKPAGIKDVMQYIKKKIDLGISEVRTKNTNPLFIEYTNPNAYCTNWIGVIGGLETGFGFNLGKSKLFLEITCYGRYSKVVLFNAHEVGDGDKIPSKGTLRTTSFGLMLSLSYQKISSSIKTNSKSSK